MTKGKLIALTVLVAVMFAASAYVSRALWLSYMPWGKTKDTGSAATKAKCKTVYTCPMHKQVIKESPGDCPICGMTLIRKEVAPAPGAGAGQGMQNMSGMAGMKPQEHEAIKTVSLDPRERMLANVATTRVREESISQEVDTVGKIAVDEQAIRKISSRYAGRIERLAVSFTGQYVKKGQELFTIYSPEILATQKEYLIAKASTARLKSSDFPEISSGTEGVLDAARMRMKLWGLTDAQINNLDRTGQVNNSVAVYSPVAGTVTDMKARQGDYVMEGGEVFTIADLSRVWMQAEVYEYEFSKVALGSRVEVTAEAYPGKIFRGTVAFIEPSVNPESRTVKVRANLANSAGMLKPEMFVTAKILSRPIKGVVVPASAVLYTGKGNVAWVEQTPGVFATRRVTTGLRSGDNYQILTGLRPGERVVTQGGFLIDSEAQLREGAGGGMANMPGMEKSPPAPPTHQNGYPASPASKGGEQSKGKKETMPGMNM